MTTIRHADIVDPDAAAVANDRLVRIEGGTIVEVAADDGSPVGPDDVDATGSTVIPGLIDCHVHVLATSGNLADVARASRSYTLAQAGTILRGMLERGFTSVRDVGGADHGLAAAIEDGHLTGPRLFFGGRALSQTGGHGDLRPAGIDQDGSEWGNPALGRVCDGVTAVQLAARDEIRRGAHHIKIMISGGCASPTDRVDSLQFSDAEIEAIVAEARHANIYCAGHAYTSAAVERGLRLGVRTIEHGNLMDERTVAQFAAHDAYYVPTLITYVAQVEDGAGLGIDPSQLDKIESVTESGFDALRMAVAAGVPIAYGTDLLGSMHARQSDEFTLRARVQPAADILRSATTIAARLLQREGTLGTIAPGAAGDAVLVRGNPLDDIAVLARPYESLVRVIRSGRTVLAR